LHASSTSTILYIYTKNDDDLSRISKKENQNSAKLGTVVPQSDLTARARNSRLLSVALVAHNALPVDILDTVHHV